MKSFNLCYTNIMLYTVHVVCRYNNKKSCPKKDLSLSHMQEQFEKSAADNFEIFEFSKNEIIIIE